MPRASWYRGLETPYLRTVLGILGIVDIEFAYAHGLAPGTDSKEQALAKARAQTDALEPAESHLQGLLSSWRFRHPLGL